MPQRGNYTLTCWGKTHLFTRAHWSHIFDTMAADTMNLTMFWLSGVFAWFGVDALAKQFPQSQAVGSGGMCPSHRLARQLNMEYLLEMFDALPEADGFFLEIRDEYGPCLCETCQRRLDEHGSKQYGQAELSFLRAFTSEVWRRNPKAIIISTIGYDGNESRGAHADDVLFCEGIRQMSDPRLLWLVCRRNWDFPAAGT